MLINKIINNDLIDKKIAQHLSQEELKETLLKVLYNNLSLLKLWKFHVLFLKLDKETYKDNPVLKVGLAMIYIMKGEIDIAKEITNTIPNNSIYYLYINIVSTHIDDKEFALLLQKFKDKKIVLDSKLSLTAGRPSITNGFRDMTGYVKDFKEDKDIMMDVYTVLYGEEGAKYIYNIALAETLYQKNECYEALILILSSIPFLEEKKDFRVLFVALYLQIKILITNGQVNSVTPIVENLINKTKSNEMGEWIPNINAFEAWAAIYDGNYKKMIKWLNEQAPDEHQEFNMMDFYRYILKMRIYLITKKYLAITNLGYKMLSILRKGRRNMDECEVLMILALSDYARGDKEEAFKHIESALAIAERYRYDRLLADEGERMYKLLIAYRKEKGKSIYLNKIINLSQQVLLLYPNYLKEQLPNSPSLTNGEIGVVRLLNDGRSNNEMCALLNVSLNTIKFYTKNIFKKLGVNNRYQAVKVAKELGII